MNTIRTLKIGAAAVTIAYVFCYIILGIFPALGDSILPYMLHLSVGPVENIFTFGNFIAGLIIWNLIVGAGIWLVGFLAGYIKN